MATAAFDNSEQERLLRALAEQLKLPLMQIAREAELAQITKAPHSLKTITYTADMALRLIDSYLLSVQLESLPVLDIEPVSVSAVLQDTAQQLNELAKQYNCDLQVDLKGRYQPVMAHKQSLEAAYASLGYAFIEAVPHDEKKHVVVLGAHHSRHGLIAGVYGTGTVSADTFKRGKALFGTAKQALPKLSSTSGAGIFVANSLLTQIESPLHVSRHNNLTGLAATLLPSQQLALV